MRITQRQEYHRASVFETSYFTIMSLIATFFSVPIGFIDRIRPGKKQELAYAVRTGSYIANYILISYLLQYPLLGYKYHSPIAFSSLLQLSVSKAHKDVNGNAMLTDLKRLSKGDPKLHQLHVKRWFYKS